MYKLVILGTIVSMVFIFLLQPFKEKFLGIIQERSNQAYNGWIAIVVSALIALCYKLSFFDFCILSFFVNLILNIPMLFLAVTIFMLMGMGFLLAFLKRCADFVKGNHV